MSRASFAFSSTRQAELARQRALTVTVDDSQLPEAALGSAIPVDPGLHHVSLVRGNARVWTLALTTREPGQTYEARLPATLAALPSAEKPRSRSTATWVVGATSGALLLTAGITGTLAALDRSYVDDNCAAARDYCRVADGTDVASRSRTLAWVSVSSLVLSAVGVTAAFFLSR